MNRIQKYHQDISVKTFDMFMDFALVWGWCIVTVPILIWKLIQIFFYDFKPATKEIVGLGVINLIDVFLIMVLFSVCYDVRKYIIDTKPNIYRLMEE